MFSVFVRKIVTVNKKFYRPCVHPVGIRRPLDILLDVQLMSICDQFNEGLFASSYLGLYLHSSTSNFYVQKILNISRWVWKCSFWKGTKDGGRSGEKVFDSFLVWTKQCPVSFTAFFEKMPELTMFFTDTVLQMQFEGRVWCVPVLCQVRS